MNVLISRKTFSNIIAFFLGIFSIYLVLHGAFHDNKDTFQCGLGVLLSTFCIITDFRSYIENDIADVLFLKVFIFLFVVMLHVGGALMFAASITLNPVFMTGLTVIFTILILILGKMVKKIDMKLM